MYFQRLLSLLEINFFLYLLFCINTKKNSSIQPFNNPLKTPSIHIPNLILTVIYCAHTILSVCPVFVDDHSQWILTQWTMGNSDWGVAALIWSCVHYIFFVDWTVQNCLYLMYCKVLYYTRLVCG